MKEALDKALEALKIARDQIVDPEYAPIGWSVSRFDEVLSIGKQAIAAPVQDLPLGVGVALVAIKTLLGRDPCMHANTAIKMIDVILKAHPAAQPAPVQDKCFMCGERVESCVSTACPKTITATKQAFAAPVQEPVAWMRHDGKRVTTAEDRKHYSAYETRYLIPLYTTPPAAQRKWVGLTDEEMYLNCPNWLSQEQCKVWIQQIEAKLKELNT